MAYKKKDMDALKRQLKNDPNFKARTKRPTRKIVKKEFKKKFESKKTVIKWNYKVNDIVQCSYLTGNPIGLIVSDTTYFGRKVESNMFFVLVGCRVIQMNGQHIKKLWACK